MSRTIRVIVSGDMFHVNSFVSSPPPDGRLGLYLASLRRRASFDCRHAAARPPAARPSGRDRCRRRPGAIGPGAKRQLLAACVKGASKRRRAGRSPVPQSGRRFAAAGSAASAGGWKKLQRGQGRSASTVRSRRPAAVGAVEPVGVFPPLAACIFGAKRKRRIARFGRGEQATPCCGSHYSTQTMR